MKSNAGGWVCGALNLRDFGGYRTKGGGRVRSGLLFRSAQLDGALPADRGLVQRLGINAIVDLRSHTEARRTGLTALDGFTGKFLFAEGAGDPMPEAMRLLNESKSKREIWELIADTYRRFPLSIKFQASLRLYVNLLLQSPNASLVHCFAGKDRTGVAVAVLQTAIGVHPDDVMREYLLTNSSGKERVVIGIAALRSQTGSSLSDTLMGEVMGVRAAYLEAAINEISGKFGSLQSYLECVTGSKNERLVEQLVV